MLYPKILNNPKISAYSSSNTCISGKNFDSAQNAQKISQEEYPIISPPKQQPVSLDEISERCKKIKHKHFVDENELDKIENETRGQSANPKWFEYRFGQITASKCHRVACPNKSSTSPSKIMKEVLNYNPCVRTKAMRDGIKCEKLAITEYVKKCNKKVILVLKLKIVGFFVAKNRAFLGASPDGLVLESPMSNRGKECHYQIQ